MVLSSLDPNIIHLRYCVIGVRSTRLLGAKLVGKPGRADDCVAKLSKVISLPLRFEVLTVFGRYFKIGSVSVFFSDYIENFIKH